MEITNDSANLRQILTTALAAELERQGASNVDIGALVTAVEAGLANTQRQSEGKRPEDLNSTNDD